MARPPAERQTLKPRARSCSRPSSVILSGPHGGIQTQLIRKSLDQAVERALRGLVLDHVGQRAGRPGQGHVDGRRLVVVDGQAVDQAEVDDVDAELGVDDVAQRLLEQSSTPDVGRRGRVELGVVRLVISAPVVSSSSGSVSACSVAAAPSAWPSASLNAIQPSSAHLTRAGYFATPANATVPEHVLVGLDRRPWTASASQERVADVQRLADRLADHQVGHHRGEAWRSSSPARRRRRRRRRLAAGVRQVHPQGDLVAAGRVDVVHLGVERLAQTLWCGCR